MRARARPNMRAAVVVAAAAQRYVVEWAEAQAAQRYLATQVAAAVAVAAQLCLTEQQAAAEAARRYLAEQAAAAQGQAD